MQHPSRIRIPLPMCPPELKLLAALVSGCVLLTGTTAHADTASSVSNWNSGIETRFATPLTSGSVNTIFTAYSGTAVPYVMGTFYVGSTGTFTVSLNAGSVGQGLQIIRGSFSPNAAGVPTTALADVLYGTQAGGGVTISNISLSGGQQYTYLQLFQGFTSGTNALLSLSGPGCISLGASNLCLAQYSRLTSPSTLATASRSSMLAAFTQIGERLDSLRYGAANNLSGNLEGSAQDAGESTKSGLWIRFYGARDQQTAKDAQPGYKGDGWGSIIGLDHEFAPGLTGGIALAYSDTGISYQNELAGNSNSVRSTQISAYGSRNFGNYFIEGVAAYAQQKYDNRRDTKLNGYAYGNFTGEQWGARLNGGLPLRLSGNTVITPQLRLEWNRISQDGYRESGGDALAVSVAENSVERLRAGIGLQLEHATTIAGINARPYGKLFWQHDFRNRGIDASASFVDGSSSFVTPGQTLDRNTLAIDIGINFFNRKNFSSSLGYHLTTGKSYSTQTAQASARWAF